MIEVGSCIDSKTAFVQGIDLYSETVTTFEALFSEKLSLENGLQMFYTYNIFDSEDPDMPIKTSMTR